MEQKGIIKSMEQQGIIKQVDEPTEFVNPVVIVRKPDKTLRICLDPKNLNESLLREHYKFPTFEEVSGRMAKAKIFSVIDASKAFWQIELTEKSSMLTTFQTPYGRYRFLRLPYGIKTAPEVFHRLYCDIFKNLENVEVYIDDIIIWAQDKNEHKRVLKQVFERAKQNGIKFNREKCKFAVNKVKFLGHIFSDKGISIDNEKIQAIINMEKPKDTKAVERLLGMITYVSKFIPNTTEITAPLRDLIKQNSNFDLKKPQDDAYKLIKEKLSEAPVLQYYNLNVPCTISVDASNSGVGAVLLQNDMPVAYASKAFTSSQMSWAQIEKELYAIVFGCERFRQYVIGQTFIIESDHKPLVPILKKLISEIPIRLQKMQMRLQAFDFKIVHKPGKDLIIADTLSRAHLKDSEDDIDPKLYILDVTVSSNMSENKRNLFVIETAKDDELQLVLKLIRSGWPQEIKDVPNAAKAYHTYHNDIYEYNGLLFKNNCVIVPKKLRSDIINRVHYNHLGLEKTKSRAREIVYWPGLSKQIGDMIGNCKTCLKFQRSNAKETLHTSEIPDDPWETIGADLFKWQNKTYLLITDYFSKYIEVINLKDETSRTTIKALKSCIVRWGIPKVIRSVNGPQFSSLEFKAFAETWDFKHITSSPTYPNSNGMVERQVQTVKRTLKKAFYSKRDPYLAMLELMNTPIAHNINSPNQILLVL